MQKVREGYKMTELGETPIDWRMGKLDDVCFVRSEKYNPVNNSEKDYIALEHIEQGVGRINGIGKSSETTSMKSVFKKGDILFGKLRPYLKKYWYAEFDGVCATEILPLITNKKNDSRFCYYMIQQDNFIEYVDKSSFGTKMPRTSWNEMKEYLISIPPLNEQKKISLILSSIDEQIEITDSLIEKSKELKEGIMQKLLTQGIGHDSFKDTEVGRIPEEWEIRKAGEVFHTVTDYVANGSFASLRENVSYKDEEDYAVLIRLTDYNNNFEGPFVYVDKKAYDFLSKSSLNSGDIIIANVGAYAGFPFRVKEINKPMTLGPNAILVRSNENEDYIYYWLQSRLGQENLKSIISTTAQPKFNKTDFKTLLIPIPGYEEQKKISLILSSLDQQIEQYKAKKEKLQELKKGLMQRLLTGNIRVKV